MKKPIIRDPVVSGHFYPDSPEALRRQIESFLNRPTLPIGRQSAPFSKAKADVLGCVLPHAGYDYSGKVAVETVSGIKIKERIILFGPNHTGLGAAYSIMTQGTWQTPLGDVQVDTDLATRILESSKYLKDDRLAHLSEHSLEVELPILQYFSRNFKIVPIAFLSDNYQVLKQIGAAIGALIAESGIAKSVILVASSDMTHYQDQQTARHNDSQAIKAILDLDEDELVRRVKKLNISMCGVAPVVAMLSAVKALGAKSAKLVKYQTSGDISGDFSSVVGYAGIVIN